MTAMRSVPKNKYQNEVGKKEMNKFSVSFLGVIKLCMKNSELSGNPPMVALNLYLVINKKKPKNRFKLVIKYSLTIYNKNKQKIRDTHKGFS